MDYRYKKNIAQHFSTKKSLHAALFIIFTTPLQSFFNCCNDDKVKEQPQLSILLAKCNQANTGALIRNSTTTTPQRPAVPARPMTAPAARTSSITCILTTTTAQQPRASGPNSPAVIAAQLVASHARQSAPCNDPALTIFNVHDIQNLEDHKNYIPQLIEQSYQENLPMFYDNHTCYDRENEHEHEYVKNKNIQEILKKHLRPISSKFIQFIHNNLNKQNLEEIINQELIILETRLQTSTVQPSPDPTNLTVNPKDYIKHLIIWLKMIAKEEIKQKNLVYEYTTTHIQSFLKTLSNNDFKKEYLNGYQAELLDTITHAIPSHNDFSQVIEIKKFLAENPSFITVIEEQFAQLFLQKTNAVHAQPSAEPEVTLPHAIDI